MEGMAMVNRRAMTPTTTISSIRVKACLESRVESRESRARRGSAFGPRPSTLDLRPSTLDPRLQLTLSSRPISAFPDGGRDGEQGGEHGEEQSAYPDGHDDDHGRFQ